MLFCCFTICLFIQQKTNRQSGIKKTTTTWVCINIMSQCQKNYFIFRLNYFSFSRCKSEIYLFKIHSKMQFFLKWKLNFLLSSLFRISYLPPSSGYNFHSSTVSMVPIFLHLCFLYFVMFLCIHPSIPRETCKQTLIKLVQFPSKYGLSLSVNSLFRDLDFIFLQQLNTSDNTF